MNAKFKITVITNWTRFLLAAISIATMVLMPVADGMAAQKQAEEWNENFVKNTIVELGLNKPQTLGQFYDKNKSKFPKGILDLVDATVAGNRNQKLPQFEVTSVKGTNGERVPVLRVTKDGALFNIELHNNERFFAKVGNVELTQGNIQNFTDIFVKLYNADPKFKKLGEGQVSSSAAQYEFNYPEMTKELWKSMTPYERVAYITNLRLMWGQARDVLQLDPNSSLNRKNQKKDRKTSSIDSIEYLFDILVGQDSEAASTTAPPATPGIAPVNGSDPCLIAGYVTSYRGQTTNCTLDAIEARYSNTTITGSERQRAKMEVDFFKSSWDHCKQQGKVACNPMIYGMHKDGSGNPICISQGSDSNPNKDFQRATHFNGPCESNSILRGSDTEFLTKDLKDGNRYKDENRSKTDEQIAKEMLDKEKEAKFANTKKFVEELIKGKAEDNSKLAGLHKLFIEGNMTPELHQQLVTIQQAFNGQIEEAKKSCQQGAARGAKNEKYFWGACDQMHRRQLFLKEYIESVPSFKCPEGGSLNPNTLLCTCKGEKTALPGAKTCTGAGSGTGDSSSACPEPFVPAGGSSTHCECKSNSTSSSLDILKNKSKAEIARLCPATDSSDSVKCASNMEATKYQGADACKCKNGTLIWELPALAEELKKNTPIEKLCQKSGSGAAGAGDGKPDADGGKCESVKPICTAGKNPECKKVADSSVGKWECPAGSTEEPGFGSKLLDWLKKAAPWIAVGLGIWWINKKAPRPPPIIPPGDNCGAGGIPCTTPCQNVNHVRSPVSPYICGCREPGPGMVIVDHTTCEPVKATDTPQEITCGDGSKVTPPAECPTKTCAGGITVPVGVECPVEIPSTKPTSNPTGVQK